MGVGAQELGSQAQLRFDGFLDNGDFFISEAVKLVDDLVKQAVSGRQAPAESGDAGRAPAVDLHQAGFQADAALAGGADERVRRRPALIRTRTRRENASLRSGECPTDNGCRCPNRSQCAPGLTSAVGNAAE